MGGIIVVDFIDMHDAKNRRTLYEKLKEEMAKDRAKHSILPPSKFGLIQITRQRVRPEMSIQVLEQCPVCNGTGKIKSSLMIIDDIENHLDYLIHDQNEKKLTLTVHPFIHAYLTQGLFTSKQWKWFFEYNMWIKIIPVNSYHMLEYHFLNKNKEEINK